MLFPIEQIQSLPGVNIEKITITCVQMKHNKHDVKDLSAMIADEADGTRTFTLQETNRSLQRRHITLSVGDEISTGTGLYKCFEITKTNHPKYPILKTIEIETSEFSKISA